MFGDELKLTANNSMELLYNEGTTSKQYYFVAGVFVGVDGNENIKKKMDQLSCILIPFQFKPDYPLTEQPFEPDSRLYNHM